MKLFRIINFLFLFNFLALFSQSKYANLTSFVTDDAQIFTKSEKEILESKLYNFETKTSNQIVILTINSLNGIGIEQYAVEVFNTNKLGQEHLDNGILILYAKKDREVRLEIGYGLEPIITDALSKRIIEKTMIPDFKEGNNFNGIDTATNQLIEFITDPKLGEEFIKKTEPKTPWFVYLFISIFVFAFLGFSGLFLIKIFKRLIEVFRGFFTGQISFFYFLMLFIGSLFSLLFILPFLVMPLFFSYLMLNNGISTNQSMDARFFILIPVFLVLSLLISIIIALYKVFFTKSKPFKINWLKSNSKYIKKTFSSKGSYSSSFGSGSSSSSSSSSFFGGGGSSGGGGASGSW